MNHFDAHYLTALYFAIDELVKFYSNSYEHPLRETRGRPRQLGTSGVLTILIAAKRAGMKTTMHVHMLGENMVMHGYFKSMPEYSHFTRLIRKLEPYLDFIVNYINKINVKEMTNFYIIDAAAIPITLYNRKKFIKWAHGHIGVGKNMNGWFQGLKLHLVVNEHQKIVACLITMGNFHDSRALFDDEFLEHIKGLLIGDKGYIIHEEDVYELSKRGIDLIFKKRDNMDQRSNELNKELLAERKRIERVFGTLRDGYQMVNAKARTIETFKIHIKAAILAHHVMKLQFFKPQSKIALVTA